jgi:hypothetical protein
MTDRTTTHTVTLIEARKIISKIKGQKTFALMAHSFMPTSVDRGYEGGSCIVVTKAAFLKVIADMLSPAYAEKGAKLRLHVSEPMFPGHATFISCH